MPEWIKALLPHLTDGELVELSETVLEEMSQRAICDDECQNRAE
jgi:hypothetical protein